MLIIFYYLLAFFAFFSFSSVIYWSLKNGISPAPTSLKQRKVIFKLIKKSVPSFQGTIYELGSGFFPLSYQAAKLFPNNQVIAYESSFIPFLFSKIYLLIYPLENLKIIHQNFFNISLNQGKLFLCYLYPEAMKRLKTKFEDELTKDCYIISNTFALPQKKPEKVIQADDLYKTKIYLYKS